MSLHEKDEKLLLIQELIEAKREMLLDKQKKLKNIYNQNHYLEGVRKNYEDYYNYIAQQKYEQIKALEILNNYISDLSRSNQLTTYNIEDAESEQNKILHEISKIRTGLDSIMGNLQSH